MHRFLCYVIFFIGLIGYSQTKEYRVVNLDINTEYSHFGLMAFGDTKIIFTSYELDKKGNVKLFANGPVLTIYEGELSENGTIANVKPIPIDSKQNLSNITSAAITPDGNRIYITTQYTRKNRPSGHFNKENFHIVVGDFKAGLGWTNFKVLPFCNPKYSYAHPTVSKDGKTLYFIASIKGGREISRGSSDIFKVTIFEDGTYSEPKNLGTKVNSYSKEMFPFINTNNTLYFASNRPGGFGGFDIYRSIMKDDGTFEKSEKLPQPFNSKQDDFSLIMDAESKTGYFTSKRSGGKGDDDIYFFVRNK